MADPAFIQALQTTQTTCYLTVAASALVAYDQVLTFSQEVNHIWNRQWSFMTALYLIARYFGSFSMIGLAATLMGINWTYSGYIVMYLAVCWANNIFLLTMQAILVIRVYALLNRSKKILIFLATFYILQAIAVCVMVGLLLNGRAIREYIVAIGPTYVGVGRILSTNNSVFLLPAEDSTIPSVVLDAVLLFLALWAFVRHSLEAKTSDGGWSINVLVRTLVADHLVYFICYLTWLSLSLAANYISEGFVQLTNFLNIFNGLVVVAGPRMVLSLRATENNTRGEGGTLEGEVSTIRFGIQEPPTQSESVIEQGGAPSSG